MLVNLKDLLKDASARSYAVGSFSVANMEMIIGIVCAAEQTKSPIILQIAEVRLNHSPLRLIGPVMLAAARSAGVPVAVHLDHATTFDCIEQALNMGFTSVMYDGSHLSDSENAENTLKVMRAARRFGAAVEAEIGCVGGSEDGSEDIAMRCTSVAQAKSFYEKTNVDALAIAIGNAHGNYKFAPQLRFDILEQVSGAVDVPLVLHGGTGISEQDFIMCRKKGIRKINIATATFDSVEKSVQAAYRQGKISGYYDLHTAEIEGAFNNAVAHMKIFDSVGKA